MRNLGSCCCWRCTLCPCKVRNKFLVNFWNRTILLCVPCICHFLGLSRNYPLFMNSECALSVDFTKVRQCTKSSSSHSAQSSSRLQTHFIYTSNIPIARSMSHVFHLVIDIQIVLLFQQRHWGPQQYSILILIYFVTVYLTALIINRNFIIH